MVYLSAIIKVCQIFCLAEIEDSLSRVALSMVEVSHEVLKSKPARQAGRLHEADD